MTTRVAQTEVTYFPGRDYPDREVWLAKRYTDPKLKRGRSGAVLYAITPEQRRPLILGINKLKRDLDARGMGRRLLIQRRHAFYRAEIVGG